METVLPDLISAVRRSDRRRAKATSVMVGLLDDEVVNTDEPAM